MMSIGSMYRFPSNIPCEIIRNKFEIKSGKLVHSVEMMRKKKYDPIPGTIQPRSMIGIINM